MTTPLKRLCYTLLLLLFMLTSCGSETAEPAGDPPGALVRLQRNSVATSLPGDLTIFGNGGLQLYVDSRGALRKALAPADLAGLQAALSDQQLDTLADSYPATLATGAGDTLTIYGPRRRVIRYDPNSSDLPDPLQGLIDEIMNLRKRF